MAGSRYIHALILLVLAFTAYAGRIINDDLVVQGKMEVESVTDGSKPCPVMTNAQMNAIASPEDGDCIYSSTDKKWYTYNGTTALWEQPTPADLEQRVSDLESAPSSDVVGPDSSLNNAVAVYDGTTGKLLKNTNVFVTGNQIATAGHALIGSLDIGSVDKTISTNTPGTLHLKTVSAASGIQMGRKTRFTDFITFNLSNDTTSGTEVTLPAPTTKIVRLMAEGDLVSIAGIAAGEVGQELTIMNQTGAPVEILNESAASTDAQGMIATGTGEPIPLATGASITLVYDVAYAKWFAVGGVGGGSVEDTDLTVTANGINKSLYDALIDGDFAPSVMDQTISVEKPIVTEWEDITSIYPQPEGTGTSGGVYSIVRQRRNGPNNVLEIRWSKGAVAGTGGLPVTFPYPSGRMPDLNESAGISGTLVATNTTLSASNLSAYLNGSAGITLYKGGPNVVGSDIAAGTDIVVNISYPVLGWTATETTDYTIPMTQSGLVQEEDSYYFVESGTSSSVTAVNSIDFGSPTKVKGDAITYDSANKRFMVSKSGIYTASFQGIQTGPTLANAVVRFNGQNMSAQSSHSDNSSLSVTASGYLEEGQNIDFLLTAGTIGFRRASISYQGTLKQVNVNPNQKAPIPTSEVRMEGASSRGTLHSNTAVIFDTVKKMKGDAITVDTDAEGTKITVRKRGTLTISSSATLASATYYGIRDISGEYLALDSVHAAGTTFFANTFWKGDVEVGDVFIVAAGANPVASANNELHVHHQELEVAVSVTNVLPQFSESDSVIQLEGATGYGSGITDARRFATVLKNLGEDIEYIDSPILGGQFVAKSNGIYHVSFSEQSTLNVAVTFAGIKVDGQYVAFDREVLNTATASHKTVNASWSGYLEKGQVVTAVSSNTNGEQVRFTMSKAGKPNVTGVDVTPFARIPYPKTQSSFLSNASAVAQGVNVSGALASSKGSGLYSYDPSTGVYTALKKISVVVSASLRASGATAVYPLISFSNGVSSNTYSPAVANQWATTSSQTILEKDETFLVQNGFSTTSANKVSVLATAHEDTIFADVNDPNKIGEPYFSFNDQTPIGYIPAMGSSIGKSTGDYTGEDYYRLFEVLWRMPGLSTTTGPFVISAAKGASAKADWDAGRTITIDLSGYFLRAVGGNSGLVGANQLDTVGPHNHRIVGKYETNYDHHEYIAFNALNNGSTRDTNTQNNTGTVETRPLNTAGYAYIRYEAESKMLKADFSDDLRYVYVKAAQNNAQTFPHNSDTTITGWTESKDTDDIFNASSGIATFKKEGIYRICASYIFEGANTAGTRGMVRVYKNGAFEKILALQPSNGVGSYLLFAPTGCVDEEFSSGDTMELKVNQNSGGTVAATSDLKNNWLTITRIPGQF